MSSLNKIRILENDEQKKTNPNSNEAFELGFVDSLKHHFLQGENDVFGAPGMYMNYRV